MESALGVHRLQFAFTLTFHYIFPQLTMGLALLILILKTVALRTGDQQWNAAARFWGKIFGISFALGVVTGIPMEFQFGTNWSVFSKIAGGVIGQTLAMEGVFSFFLESSFLGLFLFGEKRLGEIGHWFSTAKFLGLAAQPLGPLAVCTHHGRCGADRMFRDGRAWCVLLTFGATREVRHDFYSCGCNHRSRRSGAATVSHRGPPGRNGRRAP